MTTAFIFGVFFVCVALCSFPSDSSYFFSKKKCEFPLSIVVTQFGLFPKNIQILKQD